MEKSLVAETRWCEVGEVIVTVGGPPPVTPVVGAGAAAAGAGAAAAAAGAWPPTLSATDLNHQPLEGVWTYTLSVTAPPGSAPAGTVAYSPEARQKPLFS